MTKGLGLFLAVAVFVTLVGCAGTNYTVRAGFVHDYLSTDSEGDIAGWGAGGTIGVIANDGLQAVQLCGRSSFSFGKSKDDRGTLRESINSTPIEVCAEFPVGF